MYWAGFLTLAALPAAFALPSHPSKRDLAATGATLYAYGTNISGLPILFSSDHGLLYIGQSNLSSSGIASVAWDIPTLSTASTTETTATLTNGTSPGFLYTSTDNSTVSSIGIVNQLPSVSNGTSTGFTLYGKQLVYYDGSSVESKFWAKPSPTDGYWTLVWNTENEDQTEMTPVSLKTSASS